MDFQNSKTTPTPSSREAANRRAYMWRTHGCLHPKKNLLEAGQGWFLQRTHIDYTSGPWVSGLSGSPPPNQHFLIFYNINIIKCAHSHQSPVEKGISQSASPRHLLTPQTAPPPHWNMVVVASCCGGGWEAGPLWGGCSYYGDVLEQKLFVSASDLILGGRSTFQQHMHPQLTAKTTLHGSRAGMTHQGAQSSLESLARLEDFCKPVEAHTILCVFC